MTYSPLPFFTREELEYLHEYLITGPEALWTDGDDALYFAIVKKLDAWRYPS